MERKILIDINGKRELAKHFGITVANVSLALRYKRNSDQSERIRQMALQQGGKMVEMIEVKQEHVKQVKILDKYGHVKASKVIS